MKTFITLLILCKCAFSFGQQNVYASIGAIHNNVLTVKNLNETYRSFNVNEKVIILQVENKAVAGRVSDTSSKVSPSTQVLRKYMVVTVTDIERSGNAVTSIKISRNLQSSFYINSDTSVQLMPLSSQWTW